MNASVRLETTSYQAGWDPYRKTTMKRLNLKHLKVLKTQTSVLLSKGEKHMESIPFLEIIHHSQCKFGLIVMMKKCHREMLGTPELDTMNR
ncbi:unnamed protein product, partial [Cyprideis torosa]